MFAILHYLTAFSRTQTKGILPVFLFLTSLVSAGLASQKGLYSVVVLCVKLFGPGDKGRAGDHFYPTYSRDVEKVTGTWYFQLAYEKVPLSRSVKRFFKKYATIGLI